MTKSRHELDYIKPLPQPRPLKYRRGYGRGLSKHGPPPGVTRQIETRKYLEVVVVAVGAIGYYNKEEEEA